MTWLCNCHSLTHLSTDLLWGRASLVAQTVKNPPAMPETWVRSPERGMATHSSILPWRILMDRGAWRATVHEASKSQTWLRDYAPLHFEVSKVRFSDKRNTPPPVNSLGTMLSTFIQKRLRRRGRGGRRGRRRRIKNGKIVKLMPLHKVLLHICRMWGI